MVSPSSIPYLSCTFHPDCALLFHLCQIRHYYSNSFSIFRNSTSFTEANAYTGTQLKDSYALYGIFISLWGLTPMFHFWCHGTKLSKLRSNVVQTNQINHNTFHTLCSCIAVHSSTNFPTCICTILFVPNICHD